MKVYIHIQPEVADKIREITYEKNRTPRAQIEHIVHAYVKRVVAWERSHNGSD